MRTKIIAGFITLAALFGGIAGTAAATAGTAAPAAAAHAAPQMYMRGWPGRGRRPVETVRCPAGAESCLA